MTAPVEWSIQRLETVQKDIDKQLATLLKIGNDEELTYFNLQRYMSPHFAKANSGGVPEVEKHLHTTK